MDVVVDVSQRCGQWLFSACHMPDSFRFDVESQAGVVTVGSGHQLSCIITAGSSCSSAACKGSDECVSRRQDNNNTHKIWISSSTYQTGIVFEPERCVVDGSQVMHDKVRGLELSRLEHSKNPRKQIRRSFGHDSRAMALSGMHHIYKHKVGCNRQ
jgi:hypothetical protein